MELPKYIQEVNDIIDVLADQPGQVWNDTQKELAKLLALPQPVLSVRMKLLIEQGKVRKGDALPMRGSNYALELVDPTHFDGPVRKKKEEQTYHPDDRIVTEEEESLPVALELGDFSPDKIGMAVLQTLHEFWEREQEHRRNARQLEEAASTFRGHLDKEHRLAQKLARRNKELESELESTKEHAMNLRKQMNEMIIKHGQERRGATHRISDVLDEESRQMLERLTS